MKYTTVKISEIAAHPTLRLDPGYWLNKKKLRPKRKRARAQATSAQAPARKQAQGRVGPQGRKPQAHVPRTLDKV